MTPEVDVVLAELADVLGKVLEHRRDENALLRRKRTLLAQIAKMGVPKTGAYGIATVVREYLAGQGWSTEQIEATGMSESSVRTAIGRALP